MPYTYTYFDDVELPIYNIEQDLSASSVPSARIDTINGATIDYLGATTRSPQGQTIAVSGYYIEEQSLIVDDLNNFVTDENGDRLITGLTGETLRAKTDALRNKLGQYKKLFRRDLEDSTLNWKMARLVTVQQPKKFEHRGVIQQVTAILETPQAYWKAAAISEAITAAAAGAYGIDVPNQGAVVTSDIIIEVTAVAAITSIRIRRDDVSNNDTDFTWTGTLSIGETIIFDCGARTVKIGDTGVYSGFAYNIAHASDKWLTLYPGSNNIGMEINGQFSIVFGHYNQWI